MHCYRPRRRAERCPQHCQGLRAVPDRCHRHLPRGPDVLDRGKVSCNSGPRLTSSGKENGRYIFPCCTTFAQISTYMFHVLTLIACSSPRTRRTGGRTRITSSSRITVLASSSLAMKSTSMVMALVASMTMATSGMTKTRACQLLAALW